MQEFHLYNVNSCRPRNIHPSERVSIEATWIFLEKIFAILKSITVQNQKTIKTLFMVVKQLTRDKLSYCNGKRWQKRDKRNIWYTILVFDIVIKIQLFLSHKCPLKYSSYRKMVIVKLCYIIMNLQWNYI